MEQLFDAIGHDYTRARRADSRILDRLIKLLRLPAGAEIADVGAGTGNYSNALADQGYTVMAVEPARTMSQQAAPHTGVTWIAAVAEALPLADASVDAVVAILSYHHFSNPAQALAEMDRVCRTGVLALFTFDPRQAKSFWFGDYFPEVWQAAFDLFPPISSMTRLIEEVTGKGAHSEVFSLPPDLTDQFAAAGWRRPETYLDAQIRQGMSAFCLADQAAVESGIELLAQDLQSGEWRRRYGWVLELESYDAGYRFLCARPSHIWPAE